jgi:myo-inositol catabolism protein IolC
MRRLARSLDAEMNGRHLYLLAFDHRGSFQTNLLGISGEPTPDEVTHIETAKRIIFTGFRTALDGGLPLEGAGILVDEQFGAAVAREALALGAQLAMPVEKSGQDEFDFEYGEQFGDHIASFDPTYAKVLVRYNAEGDVEMNRRQGERLARLGSWLHDGGRRFLFELLVPAEPHQLARVDGDADRYDRELRPDLMVAAIGDLQAAGVEPDIWKIEGLDAREDCVRVATAARTGGRDHVECVVLGRGGDESKVVHWLQIGAGVTGFIGFAVGRTIWWNPLEAWLAGTSAEDTAATIAGNYRRLVDAYGAAEAAVS